MRTSIHPIENHPSPIWYTRERDFWSIGGTGAPFRPAGAEEAGPAVRSVGAERTIVSLRVQTSVGAAAGGMFYTAAIVLQRARGVVEGGLETAVVRVR